jgi:hypothetical protein
MPLPARFLDGRLPALGVPGLFRRNQKLYLHIHSITCKPRADDANSQRHVRRKCSQIASFIPRDVPELPLVSVNYTNDGKCVAIVGVIWFPQHSRGNRSRRSFRCRCKARDIRSVMLRSRKFKPRAPADPVTWRPRLIDVKGCCRQSQPPAFFRSSMTKTATRPKIPVRRPITSQTPAFRPRALAASAVTMPKPIQSTTMNSMRKLHKIDTNRILVRFASNGSPTFQF